MAQREAELRPVTILIADLVGSTALAERAGDPEAVRTALQACYRRMSAEVERHGGYVDKFMGDAVMALFGAPVAHEDDAPQAIRCGLALHAAITQLATEAGMALRLRVGIDSGLVAAGTVGPESRQEYTVLGDAANEAARLQAAAPVGVVLVGDATERLARRAFAFEAVPPLDLKGKAEPVRAFLVRDEL